MKKPTKTSLKAKADKLFSLWVREGGICERCGATKENVQLQAAHIFSRRYLVTRYDPLNAVCLDAKCHMWAHQNPVEFVEWLREYLGSDVYEELRYTAKTKILKPDYQEIIEQIKNKEGVYQR
jgi:hypothetical protein